MKTLLAMGAIVLTATAVSAAPLIPAVAGHDFTLDAFNTSGTVEYLTNGTQPDTLTFERNADDHEVGAFWPNWPLPPMVPVWDLSDPANFGGDFVMNVQFTGQDAPYGDLTVSLTGTGANDGADVEIYGSVVIGGDTISGLLWAIDLDAVSLYGYADDSTYILEGVGTVVDCELATYYPELLGGMGAVRGHLDFFGAPDGWMPPLYDPLGDEYPDAMVRAAYSAETGLIPEPGALFLLLAGAVALLRRN
ncbi:MAG: PEP-CTERM sorting domain-containing protein [Phycisphaerae bacterium]|jgi:hypothetical protein